MKLSLRWRLAAQLGLPCPCSCLHPLLSSWRAPYRSEGALRTGSQGWGVCVGPWYSSYWTGLSKVLSQCSIAVNRHHDQGNSYRGGHLTGDLLTALEGWSMVIVVGSTQAWRWSSG